MRMFKRSIKLITSLITAMMLLTVQYSNAAEYKPLKVNINGSELKCELKPYMYEGRVMINLKSILNAFNSDFSWDEGERVVKAVKWGKNLTVRIDSKEVSIDGKIWLIDAPVRIISDSTYVPLSFFKKAYEINAEFNEKTSEVNLSVYSDEAGKLYPYRPVLFFGDSITEGLGAEDNQNSLPRLNAGINGNKTSDMLERLSEVISVKPKKLFIMAGINDICSGRELKNTVDNYGRMLDTIKAFAPDCEVYVESVLPLGDAILKKIGYGANDKVNELNRSLIKLAKDRKITYIDIAPLYKDKNGRLDAKYTLDGVHLLPEAYREWKEAIKKYQN